MKINSPLPLSLLLSSILLVSFCAPCQAQSITGSWQLADAKGIATEKATGKKQDFSDQLAPMVKMMVQEFTFRADHTMIQTFGFKGSKMQSFPGTYTLEGDKLNMTTELTKKFKDAGKNAGKDADSNPMSGVPPYVAVQFKDGNMVFHFSVEMTENGKTALVDEEWIYRRK